MPEDLLMRFLDGDLEGEAEASALHKIAEDREARALLRLDADVRRASDPGPMGRLPVPPDFAERVMEAIAAREETETGWAERVREALFQPRTLVWRPVHALGAAGLAAAAALALVLLPAGSFEDAAGAGSGDRSGGPVATRGTGGAVGAAATDAGRGARPVGAAEGDTVLVRFLLEAPSAGSVAVAGDFSRWDPIALTPHLRDGTLIWSGVVAVPRGEHRYMFVVDGSRWVTDPLAVAVKDDGFGNRNAILSL